MNNTPKKISGTNAIQLFQIARYGALILTSVLLTKTGIDTSVIGHYENFILLAGTLSFFWVNGLTHTFLSVYNQHENKRKVIGQTAIIVIAMSICVALCMLIFRVPLTTLFAFDDTGNVFYLLLCYFIFNNISFLLDYMLLARNNVKGLLWLSVYHLVFQTALIALPAFYFGSFETIITGLLIFTGCKFIITVFFLLRNNEYKPDKAFIIMYLQKAAPLIIAFFLGGMSIYVDGIIVNNYYDKATFATYQYGAREFPLSLLLANALSASMILKIGQDNTAFGEVKKASLTLIHRLFPVGIVLLIVSQWVYPVIFNATFSESFIYFNIYMLLLIPRLLFPHSILLGLNQQKTILMASVVEFTLNIALSLTLLQFMGLQGIALGTVIAFVVNKTILLITLNKQGIPPSAYIPLKQLSTYSVILVIVFILFTYVV